MARFFTKVIPEILFEGYSDMKWREDDKWLESCRSDGDFSPSDGGSDDRREVGQ